MTLMQRWSSLLLAALGVGFGILLPPAWFLAPLGLAVFTYLILYEARNAPSALAYGLVVGIASGAAGVWWMWDMLPINSPPGIAPATQIIVAGSVWAMTALLAGLTTALGALALYLLRTNRFIALLAGVIWLLQEEARMWAYALFSYSPQSLFGPHFSQTALAYAFAENTYLLQLARFGGIEAMSFAVGALAASGALLAHGASRKKFGLREAGALGLAALILLAPLFASKGAQTLPPLRIAMLSLSSTPDAPRIDALLREAALHNPDIVLIPESDTFEYFFPDPHEREYLLATLFKGKEGLVMSAGYENVDTETRSVLSYTSSANERVAGYQKMFLMPQGEYYPIAALPLFSLAGDPKMSEYVKSVGHRLVRGNERTAVPFRGAIIGGLICSELLSPHMYEELAGRYGATVLVNLSNPSWFHGAQSYFNKTVEIAKVHAVENRAPLFVAENGSPSFVIGPDGTVLQSAAWGKDDILITDIGNQ